METFLENFLQPAFLLSLITTLAGFGGWSLGKWRDHKKQEDTEIRDIQQMKESIDELRKRVESNGERLDAVAMGLLATHRKNLVDAYEDYVVDGNPLTVERRHEIDKQFEAYSALGGNGTIKRLYIEICHVPTHIVGEG